MGQRENQVNEGQINWALHCGDASAVLGTLPEQSVHCIVTSPPYWGLRDYGHTDQIGLEPSRDAFVAALVGVFSEARRVLRDDGVMFLNLGDSYADKQLIGIPWRVAFALQADGWYLRSDVIWAKPNPMPESVTDRPTKAHEYVFLLTKSPRYWYDADAIAERGAGREMFGNTGPKQAINTDRQDGGQRNMTITEFRNARTVWQIATEASPYEHFAVMPKALARRCILAGCPRDGTVLDPFAGVCTAGVVALERGRSFVGVELSQKYHAMGRERLADVAPLLATEMRTK